MGSTLGALQVTDWRRRVFGLYAGVRQLSVHDPAAGHELWRSGRDELFAGHPSSPLLPDDRSAFTGLPVAPYDPDWRFELEVRRTDEPHRLSVETGTDGVVTFALVGTVRLPYVGTLDVWRHTGYGGGLFLPVRDGLAGQPGGTYGGGRYLLDSIKGADKLIEKFRVIRFERDENQKDRIHLDINITPYFPAKSFMLKLDGHKGDDGTNWETATEQQ